MTPFLWNQGEFEILPLHRQEEAPVYFVDPLLMGRLGLFALTFHDRVTMT